MKYKPIVILTLGTLYAAGLAALLKSDITYMLDADKSITVHGEVVKSDSIKLDGLKSIANVIDADSAAPIYHVSAEDGKTYWLIPKNCKDSLNIGDKKMFHLGREWGRLEVESIRYMTGFEKE